MPNLLDQESAAKLMPGVAARMLGVTTRTLTSMSNLHPIILPSGHRRYLRAEVEALIESSPAVPDNPHVGAAGGHVTPERKAS